MHTLQDVCSKLPVSPTSVSLIPVMRRSRNNDRRPTLWSSGLSLDISPDCHDPFRALLQGFIDCEEDWGLEGVHCLEGDSLAVVGPYHCLSYYGHARFAQPTLLRGLRTMQGVHGTRGMRATAASEAYAAYLLLGGPTRAASTARAPSTACAECAACAA